MTNGRVVQFCDMMSGIVDVYDRRALTAHAGYHMLSFNVDAIR